MYAAAGAHEYLRKAQWHIHDSEKGSSYRRWNHQVFSKGTLVHGKKESLSGVLFPLNPRGSVENQSTEDRSTERSEKNHFANQSPHQLRGTSVTANLTSTRRMRYEESRDRGLSTEQFRRWKIHCKSLKLTEKVWQNLCQFECKCPPFVTNQTLCCIFSFHGIINFWSDFLSLLHFL